MNFEEATQLAKELKNVSKDEKKILYGLYKQVTIGDNTQPKPWYITNAVAYYKWEAWNEFKGLKSEKAKQKYAQVVARVHKRSYFDSD